MKHVIREIKRSLGLKVGPKLALKQDKPDSRDWHIDTLLAKVGAPAAVPAAGSVFSQFTIIKDQGGTGSCEGQSVSNATRAAYLALGQMCPDLSALFIYYGSRSIAGGPIIDEGAYIRDGIKTLQQVGECTETVWPFIEGRVNSSPSWAAYRDATKRRGIRGYYAIPNGDVNRVKQALAAKIPVVGGWTLDNGFMNFYFKGVQEACTGPSVGNHAMFVESFQGDTFTLVNSWGYNYRESGRFRASSGFMASGWSYWGIDVRGA